MPPTRTAALCALVLAVAASGGCFDFGGYALLPDAEDPGGQDAAVIPCSPPAGSPCGTLPQCGCSEGEACDVATLEGATACIPDKGLAAGAPCGELFAGCSAGLTCVGGSCKHFCRFTRGCADDGLCFQVMNGSIGIAGMKVCTDQCDFMNPAAKCGAGLGCYPHGEADTGYSECKAAGVSTSDCTKNEDCVAGLACGEDKRCHPWCRWSVPIDCPPPQFCIALKGGQEPVFYYLGDVAYGVCK